VHYFRDTNFDQAALLETPLKKGEYENCVFKGCDLSSQDLTELKFFDCRFEAVNLSTAKIVKSVFTDVSFSNCKMLGLLFETCNEFGFSVSFNGCNLSHSSFFGKKMKTTLFRNCQLADVDFSECDLSGSKFENTNLEKADLRSAYNFQIDPEMNKLKKAKFSVPGLPGLLSRYDLVIED
jgi:uncharacterized protein YjbI with pentapeptide repeats